MSTFETTRTNSEAFEKWYKQHDTLSEYSARVAWQAATAESDRRIAELGGEVAEYAQINTRMRNILHETANVLKGKPDMLTLHSWHDLADKAAELQAHINILREALKKLAGTNGYVKSVALQALASTPAQSLQEHDNEVIERCAKIER